MHHLPEELKRQGLAEIARVLKPGGRLLILDFQPRQTGETHKRHTQQQGSFYMLAKKWEVYKISLQWWKKLVFRKLKPEERSFGRLDLFWGESAQILWPSEILSNFVAEPIQDYLFRRYYQHPNVLMRYQVQPVPESQWA